MIEITPELGVEYLEKFGFTTLITEPTEINGGIYDDINASTAIGGITQGVSNLELTAAYAAIANNGTYIKPVFYTKILDADGNVVIDNTPEKTTVIKPSTAYLLTNVMEDVVTEGTGTRVQFDGMHIAGKTGTTDNYRDLWFCGFTPYYTCSVWAGYDDNTVLPQGTYRTYQQTLWRNIIERIHADLPDTDFKMPSTVQEASICTDTGLLATSSCNSVTEYFDTEQIPTQYCSGHYTYNYNYNYDYSDDYSEDSSTDSSESSETTVEEPTPETPVEVPEETQPEVSVPEESTDTPSSDTGGEAPADTGGEVTQ